MKKLIFILILGSLFAHPEDSSSLDLLILRTSASYNGEYISIDEKYIYFKPTGNLVEQPVEKSKIEKVTLSDGTVIFDYVKSIDIYVPLDVDSPNLISSLFGDCSLSGDIGVGLHMQSIPKVSMPIRFKKMIIEPSLEFSSVTIIKKPLQATIFSIGMYRLFPINNINILGGISCGISTKNTDRNFGMAQTVTSLNLGFSYQLNDNCHLGYEWVNQRVFGTAFKNQKLQQLTSKFIIRLYK